MYNHLLDKLVQSIIIPAKEIVAFQQVQQGIYILFIDIYLIIDI